MEALSLSPTPLAARGYITFAPAALADDGVENSSIWRSVVSVEAPEAAMRPMLNLQPTCQDTQDDTLADSESLANAPEMIAWLIQNLLARNTYTPEMNTDYRFRTLILATGCPRRPSYRSGSAEWHARDNP